MNTTTPDLDFFQKAIQLIQSARREINRQINTTMVHTYYEVGKMIIEKEQSGKDRADYGKKLIINLSNVLTAEFGAGFSTTNLRQMRKFYLIYEKQQTLSAEFKLSWSHYLKLMRIDNEFERRFYEVEAIHNNWSVRELNRHYDTALFTRVAISKDNEKLQVICEKGLIPEKARDVVKDPYILEFLGLSNVQFYSESDLEERIIGKLEHFLMELGNGFTFVSRQKRISFDEKHFYIDLVFYNRMLRSFVLIDLKIGEIRHQDIGQMQMYVHYYDREIKLPDENKTIGIILCQNKSEALVRYTLPEDNEQIFASKYETILPSTEEFMSIIQSESQASIRQ
ncbi:MAG: hypothetical protein CSA03_03180 [Bacteroidetes bacterium]|nr:MAG: hypothetical protein CSA03_03180 [Bacteroidota bacterium]